MMIPATANSYLALNTLVSSLVVHNVYQSLIDYIWNDPHKELREREAPAAKHGFWFYSSFGKLLVATTPFVPKYLIR